MSRESEHKIQDVARWFDEHKRDAGDVPMRMKFLLTAMENLFDCIGHLAHDIQELEGKSNGSALYRPGHLSVRGDLTRLG